MKMYKLFALALSISLPSFCLADGSYLGIGLGPGNASGKVDIELNGVTLASETYDESGSGFSLSYGSVDETRRIYGSLEGFDYDPFKFSLLLAGYDHRINESFYVGAVGGLATLTWSEDADFGGGIVAPLKNEKAGSLALGARIGGLFSVSDNVSVDVGYRFLITNNKTEIDLSAIVPGAQINVTNERLSNLYLGVNIGL